MKKIINQTDTVVKEMCKGFVSAHPDIEFIDKYKILKKKEINRQKVTLISGGGSGHEPAHGGFIGKGMLDVAVCGDVFASPSQIQVYHSILSAPSDKGTLLIIKNYSGDMMNFKNAAYMAQDEGISVDYIKVDDDIAVQDSLYTVGRRGVAGTVLVHKIAGAAAESGLGLSAVKAAAEKAAANTRSIGFALSSCTVPAKGTPTFELEENEMEYGVGIHGEPGIRKEKTVLADQLAERMSDSLINDILLEPNDEIALLVNGFGATPLQELYLFNHSLMKAFLKKNIRIAKVFVGNYMTSIDMAGASVSIMKLDSQLKELLCMPCEAPAFRVTEFDYTVPSIDAEAGDNTASVSAVNYKVETNALYSVITDDKITTKNIIYIIDKMSECIIENEALFCDLDAHAGDGDFGMSIAKGFKRLKEEWNELTHDSNTIGEFLRDCSIVIMEHCGGASGPIWGSAFRGASLKAGNKTELTVAEFSETLNAVVDAIQTTGQRSFGRGAVVGDKTLIDALVPCVDSWKDSSIEGHDFITAFDLGAKAAVAGAEKTKAISARMGRAGTVGERSIGYPDAGAHALGIIFTDISQALKRKV